MNRQPVNSPKAPNAIGPYSPAIKVEKTIYFSGQIPLDPSTMTLVASDFKAEVKQVFLNLKAMAEASGCTLNHIVKLTIYLTDLKNILILNDTMKEFFQEPYPARTTIQVSALPKEAQVEVDAIAVL